MFFANPASPSSAALSIVSIRAWLGFAGSVYMPGLWRMGERSSRISMSSALYPLDFVAIAPSTPKHWGLDANGYHTPTLQGLHVAGPARRWATGRTLTGIIGMRTRRGTDRGEALDTDHRDSIGHGGSRNGCR